MMLTPEQRAAVACNDDLMLTACPGSGKTRVIVSKLVRSIDEVRGSSRAVACITYTNAAVNEIESRIQIHLQPDDDRYYEICTIHSFCLNVVFRRYCHLVDGYRNGFKVLTPDSDDFEKLVSATCSKFHRFNLTFRDFDEFTQIRLSPDGGAIGNVIDSGSITVPMATDYLDRVRSAGYIDFASIIYHSLCLMRDHPHILSYVSARFAYILVDEFQDTTDLQVDILALIAAGKNTRFLLVGDPFQSIFRFAGARPDLAEQFAAQIGARTDLVLSGNFRSSRPVIIHAERLFTRTPAMEPLGPARRHTEVPEWKHGNRAIDVIMEEFLPTLDTLRIPIGEAAILAPSWFTLFPLGRQLREFSVPIVGPGARPYRRNRLFAPIAEAMCGYLIEPRPDSIISIERTLFNTLLDTTGRANFDIFSYTGRVLIFRLIAISQRLHSECRGAVEWLDAAAAAFGDTLFDAGYFTRPERAIFVISVEEMKADMRNNKVDLANLLVEDLGIYASPDAALKLSTLHNSKGREYEAVAIIDLHEGKLPSYYARTSDELAEQKRLFYVGVTRAKRFLLYVTDDSCRRNGVSRFLGSGGVQVG
jgi:DNA helicase-2/ATP-dependent DNA helicase PcrA